MNPTVLAPINISDYVHHKPLSTLAAGIATMLLILFSVLCAYAQVSVWELFLSGIRRYRHKFPVIPNDAGQDLRKPLMEGTKKYPNRPFEIPTVYKKTVILPRKFIEEVKAMPDSQLSFQRDVYERLVGQHTMIGSHEHSMIQSVKFDLTTNIARMQADLQDEAAFAVREQFGPCPEWTKINCFPRLLRVIALMSGRIFVGLPLCRNEEWIHAMTHYTEDAFRGATKLWAHHPLMQPFVSWFLPEMKAVRGHVSIVQKLIQPVLRQRLQDLKDPAFEPPADMLQFLIKNGKADDGRRAAFQAKHQILAAFTAIHTTAMNACHAIYDLAAYPEHVEPLREELTTVLAEEGGIMTKSAMNKLRKLDSFFRETQRVNPANLLGMGRKVTADFRLSDGTLLKKGTFVAFDAQSINHDAELWKNPGRFDGFRFEKLRNQQGSASKYQAVTTSPDNLAFGHGTHACPGRFFAVNETKVLLAHLVLSYDWRFVGAGGRVGEGAGKGVGGEGNGAGRPENFFIDTMIAPDPTVEVEFRARH